MAGCPTLASWVKVALRMKRAAELVSALFAVVTLASAQSAPLKPVIDPDFVLQAPRELKVSHNLLIGVPTRIGDTSRQYTAVVLVFEAAQLDWIGLAKPKPTAVLSDGSEVAASHVAFRTGWTATGGRMPIGIKITGVLKRQIGGKELSLTPMMALDLTEGIDFKLDEGPNFLWYFFPIKSVDNVREFRFGKLSLLRKK